MIEITKQEALVLAAIALAVGEQGGNLTEEIVDLLNKEISTIESQLDKYGQMSIEDTNQLIKKLILKGIEND